MVLCIYPKVYAFQSYFMRFMHLKSIFNGTLNRIFSLRSENFFDRDALQRNKWECYFYFDSTVTTTFGIHTVRIKGNFGSNFGLFNAMSRSSYRQRYYTIAPNSDNRSDRGPS